MSDKELTVTHNDDSVVKAEPVKDGRRIYTPAVDICENDDSFRIIASMPGVNKDGVTVDFEEGELKIYGRVQEPRPGFRPLLSEYSFGDYSRVFRIPDGIDADNIGATIKEGVLTVVLPKQEKMKLRRIEIE